MDALRLRFPNQTPDDLVLSQGVHGIGRGPDGLPVATDDPGMTLVQLSVDRRGVWLRLRDGVRGLHVNGRPVKRMAMLRAGDSIYFEGVEMGLLGGVPSAAPTGSPDAATNADVRMVLRGLAGQYHGRCIPLDQTRLVGRAADCDIRIGEGGISGHHARLEPHGDGVVLRDEGSSAGTLVNGVAVRDALLRSGDQVVFEAQSRFVVEAPLGAGQQRSTALDAVDRDADPLELEGAGPAMSSVRRMPWLLLAALMLAGALSLLLMYGVR
ncbi:FHA domain-containing protein [Montanilutibacter psychrotolerans]|uniref:FHA domain-containing protein n=1 Tax=Montanilutibacter psychrotolerans TaxID=1327343 RepID=UPI0011CDFD37|nr:FHA domain-containing protein [Lysobacter psychrotolerans]